MCLTEVVCDNVDRMHLYQDKDQWRAVLGTAMNLRIP